MRISAGAVIPPLLLSSIVGWSVWPYWGPRSSNPPAKLKVREISASLLTKVANHSPDLDPFRMPILAPVKDLDRTSSKAPVSGTALTGSTPRNPNVAPPATPPKVASKITPLDRLKTLVTWVQVQAEAAVRSQAMAQASLPGQVALSATSLGGKRRMAVINGLIYVEGDSLRGITAPSTVILSAVRPASVQLRSGVATVDIAFSSSSKSTGQAPAIVAPKPPPRASKSNTSRKPTRPR